MIYSPREDSYLLEKQVKKYSKNKKVLDIGSGSGIQSLTALHSGASSVTSSDISDEVISHLKKLAKENNYPIKIIQSNLFNNIKSKFDLIIFNPPYLPEDEEKLEDKESQLITTGGKRGDEIIIKFLKQSINHLNKNGIILLLLSSLTPQDKILKLLSKLSLSHKIISQENLFMETLYVWEIKEIIK
jgi:release factor glutamine methyltransferase